MPSGTDEDAGAGCLIELSVQIGPEYAAYGRELWTAVEWWDDDGALRTVEGWQGPPDYLETGMASKSWWFSTPQLDQGPFRWAVYRGQGGALLGTSETFFLTCSRYTGPIVVQLGQIQPGVTLLPAAGAQPKDLLLPTLGSLFIIVLGIAFVLARGRERA